MFRYLLLFISLILYSYNLQAAEAPVHFKIVPQQSRITFEATQAGAPVNGEFKLFSSDIYFSPNALAQSRATATIEMTSFAVDDEDARSILKDNNWFNITTFPQGLFESTSFKFLGGKQYEVFGNLTIKGHMEPISLTFILNEFSKDSASITGETILKRNSFNIGDKDTGSVKDDVKVSIIINAVAVK